MERQMQSNRFFETERIGKILIRIAPPVMLAQLIQALYNIIDSYFVGKYSADGMTALSVIFPVQFIIISLAVGTGVGVNILVARLSAQRHETQAVRVAGTGSVLAVLTWAVFSVLAVLILPVYIHASASVPQAVSYARLYGNIVCVGSLGIFLESIWTKVHQAKGNMRRPMAAQMIGAITNIVLDPLLIFGLGPFPQMGIAGAAVATVVGQFTAAAITAPQGFCRPPKVKLLSSYGLKIYRAAYASILMQMTCTVYIIVLNIILAGFSDSAVTVLGLYYKYQSFFFIPLLALSTCIVPVISYNFACGRRDRCKAIFAASIWISLGFMVVGAVCFIGMPRQLISVFSGEPEVFRIGIPAFRIIGCSFFSAVLSLMTPVFFQAIGRTFTSVLISLTRQILCLIPIFWLFSLMGVGYTWIAFPASESIAGGLGLILCFRQFQRWNLQDISQS